MRGFSTAVSVFAVAVLVSGCGNGDASEKEKGVTPSDNATAAANIPGGPLLSQKPVIPEDAPKVSPYMIPINGCGTRADGVTGALAKQKPITAVVIVPCTEPHNLQMILKGPSARIGLGKNSATWPGQEALTQEASVKCEAAYKKLTGIDYSPGNPGLTRWIATPGSKENYLSANAGSWYCILQADTGILLTLGENETEEPTPTPTVAPSPSTFIPS